MPVLDSPYGQIETLEGVFHNGTVIPGNGKLGGSKVPEHWIKQRYRFVQDEDCHWFLIPEEKKEEWGDFLDRQDNYEDVPDWAKSIRSCFTYVFENPVEVL